MGFVYLLVPVAVLFFTGIRFVRSTQRGLIERLDKYHRFANPGFHWIIPTIDKLNVVSVTEQMVDAEPQEIITNDKRNASVKVQVYFRVKGDEKSIKESIYGTNNFNWLIVNLARTKIKKMISSKTYKSIRLEREKINADFHETMCNETKNWGIEIIRTELKEIDPPKNAHETMNILANVMADKYFFENAQLLR